MGRQVLAAILTTLWFIAGLGYWVYGFVFYLVNFDGLASLAGIFFVPVVALPVVIAVMGGGFASHALLWWGWLAAVIALGLLSSAASARPTGRHVSRKEDKAARIDALQWEYAHLNAELAPLLAEAQRKRAIEDELAALGSLPDRALNQEVKRRLGVEDTPFN